ncbi:GMC family oxidoreductase N-terminal domain-containing protein, partial [Enterobacter hormaechei]|uniref:GMC family oxidoreductase N-terminal domain-containing protein n=1 Tax=Enterobacter hormaechei TaxID=158836 RepID=UPI00192D1948
RASTARGYLDQAKPRPNLTIRTHAMTDHIIFDGKRAVGVEWLEGESTIPSKATAKKEVLLCAGAIASPQILQRSGVGYHFLPVAINYNGSNAVKEHGFQCHVGSMRSPSRGHVRIKSRDPHQHPAILFNYMSHEQDWQ